MPGVFVTTPVVVVDVVTLVVVSVGAAVDGESDPGKVSVPGNFCSGLTSIWRWLAPRAGVVGLLGLSAGSEWEDAEPLGEVGDNACARALSCVETLGGLALLLAVAFSELAVEGFGSAEPIMPAVLLKSDLSDFVGFMVVLVRKGK